MYARDTKYLLTTKPREWEACHSFFKAEAMHPCYADDNGAIETYTKEKIERPTIRAVRNGKVIGVMATKRYSQGLVANPCHVSYTLKNPLFTVIRLIDAYEAALRPIASQYFVIMPNFKKAAIQIFEEIKGALLVKQVLENRYNMYVVRIT